MIITYHGHSCFQIKDRTYSLIIDPFITGNPLAKVKPTEIVVDFVLVTHGHNDHVGDTMEIAKRNQATVIAPYELAEWLRWKGINTHGMAPGGGFDFPFGRVEQVPAIHGSGFTIEGKQEIIYMGQAAGFLIQFKNNKTIYHAGDTSLYSDMQLLQRKNIDIAMLPIGDNFTMGPHDALIAAEWIGAKEVIPMHYNTFDLIQQNAYEFVQKLQTKGIQGKVMESCDQICIC